MKLYKKIAVLGSLVAVNLLSCAYLHTDSGIVVKDGNNRPMVYKEVTIEEKKLDSIGKEEALRIFSDAMSSGDFEYSDIEKDVGGRHYIGQRFEKELNNTKMMDTYLDIVTNFEAEYTYSSKLSVGSKTITVKITPSKKQTYQIVSDMTAYGKGASDVYSFVITAPNKVISTNGTVESDGITVKWDTKDIINNNEEAELTLKYKDYTLLCGIFAAIILVAAYFIISSRQKTKVSIEEPVYHSPVRRNDDNKKNQETNDTPLIAETSSDIKMKVSMKKCPECGGPLSEDGTFCEKCCLFF